MLEKTRVNEYRVRNSVATLLLLAITGLLAFFLFELIFGFSWFFALVLMGFFFAVSFWQASDRAVLRHYNAQPIEPHQARELYGFLGGLAKRAGLTSVPRLYFIASPVMNAFTIGKRSDAVIAMSDGLFRALNPRELAGVMAHEIAHIRNNDMLIMKLSRGLDSFTSALSTAGQLIFLFYLPIALVAGALDWPTLFTLIMLMVAPVISRILQMALSRAREYQADLRAVELTGDPVGLASALQKLETMHEGLVKFLITGRRHRAHGLLQTHPASGQRIARLNEMTTRAPLPV